MLINVEKTDTYLEIFSPISVRMRIFFFICAFIPLLAPYQLIFLTRWNTSLNLFFMIAVILSAGAVAISVYLFYATFAAASSWMRFDKERQTFVYSVHAPVIPKKSREYPMASIEKVELGIDRGDENEPSYALRVVMVNGRQFTSNASYSRSEVEKIKNQVALFIGL